MHYSKGAVGINLCALFYYVGNVAESDVDGISKKAP